MQLLGQKEAQLALQVQLLGTDFGPALCAKGHFVHTQSRAHVMATQRCTHAPDSPMQLSL